MDGRLLHIFRNTPLGRETLLQSTYFCKTLALEMNIYIPENKRFFIHMGTCQVAVDLDRSYLSALDSARGHAGFVAETAGLQPHWVDTGAGRDGNYPVLQDDFAFMCCPRSMKEGSSKIGLGHIGSTVRRIVGAAPFPVLIAAMAHKPWRSIAVFYGGSDRAAAALRLALGLKHRSGLPLSVFTQIENGRDETVPAALAAKGLPPELTDGIDTWHRYDAGDFVENIYDVPHDALVVMGSKGSRFARNFSSKMEMVQSTLTNSLMLVGPGYTPAPIAAV